MNSLEKYEDFFPPKKFIDVRVIYLLLSIALKMVNIHLVKFLNHLNILIMVSRFSLQGFLY